MKQLVVCYPVEDRHLQAIQQAAPEYRLLVADQQTIPELIHQADLFVGHAKVPVDWDQVAEQTLAMLLGLLRGIPIFYRQQQKHEFVRRPTADLHHKRIGIVGLGGNGRRLAQILEPFRVTIRATDYFPEHKPPQVEELLPYTQLLNLAAWSEILILTLPLNASTRGIMNRSVFDAMPKGSYLINVARGQCVNEDDLIAALETGRLAGAGLDVTAVEPLPAESRLYDQPNVLITPHVGAQSGPRYDDSTRLICENLKRYLAGQPLFNIVDKKLGFPHPSVLYLPD